MPEEVVRMCQSLCTPVGSTRAETLSSVASVMHPCGCMRKGCAHRRWLIGGAAQTTDWWANDTSQEEASRHVECRLGRDTTLARHTQRK